MKFCIHKFRPVLGQAPRVATASICSCVLLGALWPAAVSQATTLAGAAAADANSVAIGPDARAEGNDAIALGNNSFTFAPFSVAVGSTTNANSLQTTALGASALADQPQATALGSFAQAFGPSALAVGSNAQVEDVRNASAMGADSLVESDGGTALGAQSEVVADAENAVALGSQSLADQANTVSVGNRETGLTRRITNVAQAVEDSDAVNFAQFKDGLSGVRHDAFAGIAAAAAFNPAIPSAPGKTAVSLGAATYRGQQAVSVSFARRLPGSANAAFNGGVAFDSSNHALGKVGIAWEF